MFLMFLTRFKYKVNEKDPFEIQKDPFELLSQELESSFFCFWMSRTSSWAENPGSKPLAVAWSYSAGSWRFTRDWGWKSLGWLGFFFFRLPERR